MNNIILDFIKINKKKIKFNKDSNDIIHFINKLLFFY